MRRVNDILNRITTQGIKITMDQTRKERLLHWTGLACLALSVVVLVMMGPLWERVGAWSMALWIALGAAGMLLLQKGPPPDVPD